MKKAVLTFAALATVATGLATPSLAADNGLRVQVQYYEDGPRPPRPDWDGPDRRPGPDGRPDWDGPGRRPDRDGRPGPRPDWGRERRDILGPRQVARTLQRRGYDVGDIRLERGTYFVRATRPSGRRVIVMVDAFSGRIVGERRAGPRPGSY